MYTVKLLLRAELEVNEACEWYEKRKPGLGGKFLEEFDHCINRIANHSLHYAVNFSEKYRFALLKVFPYSVVYRFDDENSILVISVFHQHRNPIDF